MSVDLSRLNEGQRRAVTHIDGPLLVLAGAGTGKTTVITYRIAHMLDQGIAPTDILAVTFTNKAAREMKERLEAMLPHIDPAELTVSTFHSFCCRVLRRHIRRLGFSHNFGIADESDTIDLIKEIAVDERLTDDGDPGVPWLRHRISQAKNELELPEDLLDSDNGWEQKAGLVYQRYRERLRLMNLVDFDDLLMMVVKLWRDNAGILEDYRRQFSYLLVDEFQDTNGAQAELLRLLAGDRRNLCVVGDDDQSIYGWRGADVSNILDFPTEYSGTTVIRLEENYRSMGAILAAANDLIAKNEKRHGKTLRSGRGHGDLPVLLAAENAEKEAQMVARLIKRYNVEGGIPFDDMAILYRSNHLSRSFETTFKREQVPYRVIGGKEFFERREIKDAAAYLRLISNPSNELSLRRILNVPPRGIGAGTMEKLEAQARRGKQRLLAALREDAFLAQLPAKTTAGIRRFTTAYQAAFKEFSSPGHLGDKIKRYLRDIGYLNGLKSIYRDHHEATERLANVEEFINAAYTFEREVGGATLLEFLEANALADEQDRTREKEDNDVKGVNLMTVHAAKGLEFAVVFVIAMERDIFPHERSLRENGDVDEERRLFYVAMTRAKQHLILTRAQRRARFGQGQAASPSPFLFDLSTELVENKSIDDMFEPASEDQVMDYLARLHAMLKADD